MTALILRLMPHGFLAALLLPLLVTSSAAADTEDAYYSGNAVGSAGWDLYEDDEQDELEEEARREAARKEQAANKPKAPDDFFNQNIGVYDDSISRTVREEAQVESVPKLR